MKHAPSDGAGVTQSSAEWIKENSQRNPGMRGGRRRWGRVAFRLAAPSRFWTSPFRMRDGERERERERRYGCDFAERRKEVKRTLSLGGGALPRGGKKNFTLTGCLAWPYHSVR